MKNYNQFINENLLDKMTAKSEEEIKTTISKLDSYTKLYSAIEYDYIDIAKDAIDEYELDVHWEKDRALALASYYDRPNIMKMLLELGANPDADEGRIMRYAVEREQYDIVKILIDYNVTLNYFTYCESLYLAERKNNYDIAKLLLDNGAIIDKNLYNSVKKHNPKMFKLFQQYKDTSLKESLMIK